MPDPASVARTVEPFRADGLPDGPGAAVLLIHGFTSTPASMTPWAQHLAAEGFRVSVPVLPGHGSTWQRLNATRWPDWYADASWALDDLLVHGQPVFVAGLSMGGGLALRLAEERPGDVAGLILVNPSVIDPDRRLLATPLLKLVIGSVAGIKSDIKKVGVVEEGYERLPLKALDSLRDLWKVTRRDLGKVSCPVVVFRSAIDHVVPAVSSQTVIGQVGSLDVTEHVLAESYHVAVLDNDAPQIFAESAAFGRRVLSTRAEGAAAAAADVGTGDAV